MKIQNQVHARAILAEAARRKKELSCKPISRAAEPLTEHEKAFFRKYTHDKQWKFLTDQNKLLALLCPRRTGKTTVTMFKALWTAKEFPRSDIAYVVPSSKEHAKRLFWRPLEKMNQDYKLGLEFKVAESRVITKEGSSIYVFGARNRESPNVLRGNAWSLAILDECKDFGAHFEQIIVEAVVPALEDHNGTLVLGGTPGEVLEGLFYRITNPKRAPTGWSVHKWIKSDNPFLPKQARDLDIVAEREYLPFGLTKDSPKFRREQLAQWCTDDTERAYAYDTNRNGWPQTMRRDHDGNESFSYELPRGHDWMYVLGLDLGERDKNAFCVGAFAATDLHLYVVHEFAKARMSIDELAAYTRGLIAEFGNMVAMVADTGGYGRGVVTDLQTRHNLPFEAADKSGNKLGNVALMNSDFLCGRIKAKDDGLCATEWKRLTKRVRPTDHRVVISHSDIADAALYMWRASKHFASYAKEPDIVEGSEQYWLKLEKEATERALNKRRSAGTFWGSAISDSP